MFATPLYDRLGLQWGTTLLAFLGLLLLPPIYFIYFKGAWLRERSKFAQSLASERKANKGLRVEEDEKAENGEMGR